MTRDLTRYAVRMVATGEVLDAGLREAESSAYVATYNRLMVGTGKQAERVVIDWTLQGAVNGGLAHRTQAGVQHAGDGD